MWKARFIMQSWQRWYLHMWIWCLYNKLIHFRCYCDYQKRTTGEGSEQKKTCDKQKLSDPLLNRSLRACSQGGSGGGAGKGRRACNYVFGFECLHRKSWCEMLIGGDDNSNGARTLAMLCNWYGVGGGRESLILPFLSCQNVRDAL